MADQFVISPSSEIVAFWRAAGDRGEWFAKRPAFDRQFRERFLAQHEQAAAGAFDDWTANPESTLALMILLDQFPRNAFRGTARMYDTDPQARAFARKAEDMGHMAKVESNLQMFFALPFSHSESLADQDLSVRLNRRFGRFPHRNAILGRASTAEELLFLRRGGFQG